MAVARCIGARLRALARSRIGVRFSRYTAASLVAVAVSQAAFALSYGPAGTSSGVAIVVGFTAGLVPKYLLCRNWAWRRRGRLRLGPEALAYAAVAVSGAVFAYYLTEFAEGYIRSVTAGGLQVFLMTLAFLISQGAFFIAKFVAFDRMVFSARAGPRGPRPAGRQQARQDQQSRHQPSQRRRSQTAQP